MPDNAQSHPTGPRGATGFGAAPLAQTRAAAAAMRRLTGLLLSQEQPHAAADEMLTKFAEWERELTLSAPRDSAPRLGDAGADTQRIYLDHAFDVGAFNPCFPEYRFDLLEDDSAGGSVTFGLPYAGPPGLVHGGFLAVFVDCVVQHQNCARGPAGKTRSLTMTYRRPTPLGVELRFEIDRSVGERDIESTVRLMHADAVVCSGTVAAVALPTSALPGAGHAPRRTVDVADQPPAQAISSPRGSNGE